jgi:hypothetical protein
MFKGAILLADSGYACTDWVITPVPARNVPLDEAQLAFNRAHKRTRRYVESGIGLLKQRWRCLQYEMRIKDTTNICRVIKACAILHNVCLRYRPLNTDEIDGLLNTDDDDDDGDAGEVAHQVQNVSRRDQLVATFR